MDKIKISCGKENDMNLKLLMSLSRGLSGINRETLRNIREHGIIPSQFIVLDVLYHKEEMRVCNLTKKILSTGGNMTVVISNLLKDEYIEKIPTPGDRRSYSVRNTQKAKKLNGEIPPRHLDILAESMEGLSGEEKLDMIRRLKKMQRMEE